MKDARDIRLLGIGFVAGMVLCYFLTLDGPTPTGSAPSTPPLPALPASQALQATGVSYVRYVSLFEMQESREKALRQRMRIVPAQKVNNQFPGGVPQYDLIDLNYVPDFKLPSD
jgi:hypothetical protein